MATSKEPIPLLAFQVATGFLYGTAIIAAAVRTVIRIKSQRRCLLDDAFLIFACLALTGATAMLYSMLTNIYTNATYLVDDEAGSPPIPVTIIGAEYLWPRRFEYSYVTLAWLVIFSVKFSFLAFFRLLVGRVRTLFFNWRAITVVNVFALPYCIMCTFLECRDQSMAIRKCTVGPAGGAVLDTVALAMDAFTDCLIVSIPARILWRVRIGIRQELSIGVFLSLSICTIVLACIRSFGSFMHQRGSGPIWALFWLQSEASVAVCMVSMTAFQSVFVSGNRKARARERRPWYSSTVARLRLHRDAGAKNRLQCLPTIPSATLTGMQTFIHGGRIGSKFEENDDEFDLLRSNERQTHVTDNCSLIMPEASFGNEDIFTYPQQGCQTKTPVTTPKMTR